MIRSIATLLLLSQFLAPFCRGQTAGPPASQESTLPKATKEAPFTNSLGMVFVPVSGAAVLFSIWETRNQDYALWPATRTNRPAGDRGGASLRGSNSLVSPQNALVNTQWQNVRFQNVPVNPGPDYPVVMVSWLDATNFCAWLTAKEQKDGTLSSRQFYRLPTDTEWSDAAGLPPEAGKTPEDRNGRVKGVFPWGNEWPPPATAGNYADLTASQALTNITVIPRYDDGFATTAPVGQFAPNRFGLYDLGGNVWEWCDDLFYDRSPGTVPDLKWIVVNGQPRLVDAGKLSAGNRVVRGGSWDDDDPGVLLSSVRAAIPPTQRILNTGFRVVLAAAPDDR